MIVLPGEPPQAAVPPSDKALILLCQADPYLIPHTICQTCIDGSLEAGNASFESFHCPSGLVAQFKGKVAELLRHPRGADVLVDLYDVASTAQRNAMCAEFYGKEFVLFDGVGVQSGSLSGLKQLLAGVDTAKRRSIFQHMTRAIVPIMEKAILHPPMVHR